MTNHNKVLEGFRYEIDSVLGGVLSEVSKVLLIDQPVHRNLGDTFIWQGEIDTLQRLGKKVIYKAVNHRVNWEYVDSVDPSIPILLHGGGNMGDVWIAYEEFRRAVVRRYPNRKIIILPQTLEYSDKSVLKESVKIYSEAKDLTIISRTHKGIEEYGKYFSSNRMLFAPDMALGIDVDKLRKKNNTGSNPLVIQRDDKESRDELIRSVNFEASDWVFTGINQKMWSHSAKLNRVIISEKVPELAKVRIQNLQSDIMRVLNMQAAVRMFSSASVVVSNRLHAHIFASLLGIPNFVSDNNYGKISTIYNEYTHAFPHATLTGSLRESLELSGLLKVT